MDRNDLISRSALKEAIEELEITEELVDYDCDDVSTTGVSQYLDRPDVLDLIDNAPTVKTYCYFCGQTEHGQCEERPQDEWKKYKPLEPDYNVQCAVENLRKAYWSNEPEEVAKYFTEAEDTITSAICHYGYTVCKQPQGDIRWTDKLSVKSNGDIIDFEGRVVGHINLEEMKGGTEE